MGNVIPFKRKVDGDQPSADAHIDSDSYALLVKTVIGFAELFLAEGDAGRHYDELGRLTLQLDRLARRFRSPKGGS